MAVGDTIGDYQYEFRGLIFGSGTDFITETVDGLLSMATARAGDVDNANDHGAIPGPVLHSKRVMPFDMTIRGVRGVDIEGKLATARKVFQIPTRRNFNVMEIFAFKRPGEVRKMVLAQCLKRDIPSNYETARGKAKCSIELRATDPAIYSLAENFSTRQMAIGATNSQFNVQNLGDFEDGSRKMRFRLVGPFTDVRIQHVELNRTIVLNGTANAGQVLIVDLDTRTITLDGVNVYSWRQPANQWWRLLPGANTILVTRAGSNTGGAMTIETYWRDTWQ